MTGEATEQRYERPKSNFGTPPSASPAPLQEQFGGNNFGGATMGSQQAAGGGFQVDNSTPDGQVTLGPTLS